MKRGSILQLSPWQVLTHTRRSPWGHTAISTPSGLQPRAYHAQDKVTALSIYKLTRCLRRLPRMYDSKTSQLFQLIFGNKALGQDLSVDAQKRRCLVSGGVQAHLWSDFVSQGLHRVLGSPGDKEWSKRGRAVIRTHQAIEE